MTSNTSPPSAAPPSGAANTAPAPQQLKLRQFTVDEYHLMAKAGVFVDGAPFELLEGWLVKKMTKNPPHEQALLLVDASLRAALPAGWILRPASPVTLSTSEPEPDLSVVRGQLRSFFSHHPGPADIGLLVEVADTSLTYDRTTKGRVYAEAGIPNYWVVNLVDRQIEIYTSPSGPAASPAYRQLQTFRLGDAVPFVLDGQPVASLAVNDLLP